MKYSILVFALITFCGNSQNLQQDINDMVDAELAFSKMSREQGTSTAFINFFSPQSVLIEAGKEVNGLEHYKNSPNDASYLLVWQPVFAEIAASGDFGYTTGPFKFYANKLDTTAVQNRGYYSSVWQKEKGQWKVIFDLGSAIGEEIPPELILAVPNLPLIPNSMETELELANLLEFEKDYIKVINIENKTFNPAFFSESARLHRPRFLPILGKEKIEIFKDMDRVFFSRQLNGRIANSADLAMTYGIIDVTNTEKDSSQKGTVRYLRIWRKEHNIWKIVLDVLG